MRVNYVWDDIHLIKKIVMRTAYLNVLSSLDLKQKAISCKRSEIQFPKYSLARKISTRKD